MQDAITAIAGASKNSSHPMLRPRQVQRSGYLVITSDKGLAGAYSSNVLKRLINDIKEKHTSSDEYSIIVLGQSGVDFLKNRGYEIENSLVDVPDQPSFKSIQAIAKHAIDLFSEEHIDELKFIIVTMLVFLRINQQLNKFYHYLVKILAKVKVKCLLMNLSLIKVYLSVILPQYVESLIYGTILDAKASEHAARMTAMKNLLIMQLNLLMTYHYNIIELDKLKSLNKSLKLLVVPQHLNNNLKEETT